MLEGPDAQRETHRTLCIECRRMPTIPRLPLVPDPLRRIHVPRDLKSITTIGDEVDAGEVGLDERTVELRTRRPTGLLRPLQGLGRGHPVLRDRRRRVSSGYGGCRVPLSEACSIGLA